MAAVVAPFAAVPKGAPPAVAVRVFVPVSMAKSMEGMVSAVAGGEMAEAEAWLADIHIAVGPTPSFPAEVVAVVALPLADGVSQVVLAPLRRWLQWWRR